MVPSLPNSSHWVTTPGTCERNVRRTKKFCDAWNGGTRRALCPFHRADDGGSLISRILNDLADVKKFHHLRKISSTPELKYFGLGWLLSLRRDIAGRRGTPYRDHERLKSMHIAQIAPLTEAIPPKLYGGTERVVSWLTEELIALGHEVTLFASGDSQTSAKLEAVWPRALRLDGAVRDPNALHMMMLERVYQRSSDFDVLHFHLDYYPFSLFSRQTTPFVTTLHGRLDLPEHQPVFDTFNTVPVVSISNSQRRPLPQAHWVRTVHHGLPEQLLTPKPVKPSYFAFLGRIAPEKGIDRAIRIAQHCGVPLKVAAKVDRADQDYYDEQIRAMIEAMACGTPVIAFNRGSVPEVIDDGLTGFIVEDINGAIGAVDRLDHLSRAKIRGHFEKHFTARRMAQDYLAVYRSLADRLAPHLRLVTDDAPAL